MSDWSNVMLKNGPIVCWGANDYNQAAGRPGSLRP